MQSEAQTPARWANKKAVDKAIAKLRSRLDAADMVGVAAILAEAPASELLVRVREQKLVLRVSGGQREAFIELLQSVASHLALQEREQFESYLTFAAEFDVARNNCIASLHESLRLMPACSLADLLTIADELFDAMLAEQFRLHGQQSEIGSIAENERRLHDLSGASVDIAMGVARFVNEYCGLFATKGDDRLSGSDRRAAFETACRAVVLAGEANSLEYFFDSVTYGEFSVEKIAVSESPTFRFHFLDSKRYLLKFLAIRRRLVIMYHGMRGERYVRNTLKKFESPVINNAIRHYLRRVGASVHSKVNKARALKTSSTQLLAVDAEDDLLVAASRFEPRTLAHYLIAMALRWYAIAAEVVRDVPKVPRRRWLGSASIPLSEIANRIDGIDKDVVADAIRNLTIELPARSHTALGDIPFVRSGEHTAKPFLRGGVGTWSCVVRETLIKGGDIGKSVGAIWEDYYAHLFNDTDWRVVGRGVKLRENGQTITDVDILVLRQDLLLVMQVKALIGAANGPYDHWRNRQTVEYGCFQARIAADHLRDNPSSLIAIGGKKLAASVKHIQPVVLTNIDQLDGWRVDDVPVISEVTRKAMCRGARVDYHNSQTGEVVHTHHFVKPEDLNTASILQLFEAPVEMRVAAESTETFHSTHHIGGLTLLMPEFVVRDNEASPRTHEPHKSLWK